MTKYKTLIRPTLKFLINQKVISRCVMKISDLIFSRSCIIEFEIKTEFSMMWNGDKNQFKT